MTYAKIKYEKERPDRFPLKNPKEELVNNFYYAGYSHTFVFRLPHIPWRYTQRVKTDIHARLRNDLDICMIIAHSLEETELPNIREGNEYHALIDLHIHPDHADKDTIHFGEFFIPLKKNNGYIIVPTILNKDEREAYFLRREEEDMIQRKKKFKQNDLRKRTKFC